MVILGTERVMPQKDPRLRRSSSPENQKHALRKLFENIDDFIKVALSEFSHDGQILFSYTCREKHARTSPCKWPLYKNLTKILIICKKKKNVSTLLL